MEECFCDAKSLQPVTLSEGAFKQFFLTAHVLRDQKPGVYRGAVLLGSVADKKDIAKIPVALRVLPFALPEACTYADADKKYPVMLNHYITHDFIMRENGGDWKLADRQYEAILRNFVAHNQQYHFIRDDSNVRSGNNRHLFELYKKVGINTDALYGLMPLLGASKYEQDLDARMKKKWLDENYGKVDLYLRWGDEPGVEWITRQRDLWAAYQKHGFKIDLAGGDALYHKGAYIFDYVHRAGFPEDAAGAAKWNAMGGTYVSWYACLHVGPENPAFNRKQYGFTPYLAGYTTINNYAHHLGPYNDRAKGYRPMVFAYGHYDGVIDTIQWEGFREGVDDVRYATLLKRLARQAGKSGDLDVRYAGRQAIHLLARQPPEEVDASALRIEVVQHILRLMRMGVQVPSAAIAAAGNLECGADGRCKSAFGKKAL